MDFLDTGYRRLARPVLFRMGRGDPETAHRRALGALAGVGRHPWMSAAVRRMLTADPVPRRVFGIDFPNVVGVAAGLDKDGHALRAWPALGFGFVEAGTVTAHPQPGNPTPRLFRLPSSRAIINRMGFNNDGAAALADRVAGIGGRGSLGVPLGISLGKSKVTPVDEAVGDYLASLAAVHPVADYLAVNVSSPNTPGLRSLQDRGPLDELLDALTEQARTLAGTGAALPVLVKIAPDLTDAAIGELLQVCTDRGVAGVIATNTTVLRDGIAAADAHLADESGGLSGAPLRRRALEVVRFVCAHTELPVIGVGGITTADDGLAMLDAGAALLQLYSGFIYRGPGLVRELTGAVAERDATIDAESEKS
ncbi:quinone-dependent dihydroorotate dehydrogenase [Nakamurella lactea]|uniref:quinone-dependent dihydroorotate dehydrogenase n=1 Tax=Nakamurella lactea TaxID=459515 RepID=UPI000422068A|nr:quinone-dependent dihydroorotate dehydrogenase [Nakamurella lactea]